MKKGDDPRYVHAMSNHPPAVIKAIPEGINQRLSKMSSDKQSFDRMVQPYQEALRRSGYGMTTNLCPERRTTAAAENKEDEEGT